MFKHLRCHSRNLGKQENAGVSKTGVHEQRGAPQRVLTLPNAMSFAARTTTDGFELVELTSASGAASMFVIPWTAERGGCIKAKRMELESAG